jgi:hypothetical protein
MTASALTRFESSEARSATPFPPGSTVARGFVTPQEYELAPPVDYLNVPSFSPSATAIDLEYYRDTITRSATLASSKSVHNRADRTKARFRLLRRLQRNHDGEGAAAADQESADAAIAFLGSMQCSRPYFATLNDDGFAVIEFEDRLTGFFGDLTFQPGGVVQCYARDPAGPSRFLELALDSPEMRDFLDTPFCVVF